MNELEKLGLTDDVVRAIFRQAKDDAEALERADGTVIKGTPIAWSVRHEVTGYSIDNMNDEELRQSVIEDLLTLHHWERQGKSMAFYPEDVKRFVPERAHLRVDEALGDPHVRSLLVTLRDGQIRIHPHHLQDAMDFCGVWLEGYEPQIEGVVYYANTDVLDENDDEPITTFSPR